MGGLEGFFKMRRGRNDFDIEQWRAWAVPTLEGKSVGLVLGEGALHAQSSNLNATFRNISSSISEHVTIEALSSHTSSDSERTFPAAETVGIVTIIVLLASHVISYRIGLKHGGKTCSDRDADYQRA